MDLEELYLVVFYLFIPLARYPFKSVGIEIASGIARSPFSRCMDRREGMKSTIQQGEEVPAG
jgi:hypothetical protein